MKVAGLRDRSRLAAAGRGEGDIFNAIARAIVAHGVDVAGENGGDVSGFLKAFVNPFPVVTIATPEPAGVVEEDEDVLGLVGFCEGLIEPGELLGADFLGGGLAEGSLTGFWVAFVGIEDDKPRVLVLEGIPERAEVHLVSGFHFTFGLLGFVFSPPVDVVVSRDGEPGAGELVHDGFEFLHLLHPDVLSGVAIDEIADGHDEVRFEEIGVADGVGEDGDTAVGTSGAVTVDDEGEGVFFVGEGELDLALTRGVETVGRRFHCFVLIAVTVMVVVVPDVGVDGRRVGESARKAEAEDKNP